MYLMQVGCAESTIAQVSDHHRLEDHQQCHRQPPSVETDGYQ
jgi:hypothetical protein